MKLAIVQAASIPFAVDDGLAKAHALAREAIAAGAEIVVFGETFIGGYPIWLDEAPEAALYRHRFPNSCLSATSNKSAISAFLMQCPLFGGASRGL